MHIRFTALLISAITFALTSSAVAQPGRGGGGYGGFGGGMGGRMGVPRTAEGEPATFTHILTPGDRGEWPFTVKDGETIIVRASSTAFDPKIEVVDDKGKVLADNDDIHPGEQDAQVLYRFAKGGAYKVLVKGYKSAGGGQYTFTVRRFVATDVQPGVRNAGRLSKDAVRWLRMSAKKGDTLVLSLQGASFSPAAEIIGPDGETTETSPASRIVRHTGRHVIHANEAGDYYAKLFGGVSGSSYAATLAPAKVVPIAIGESKTRQPLDAGGLTLWRFDGKPGDLVRIDASAPGTGVEFNMTYLTEPETVENADDAPRATDALVTMSSSRRSISSETVLLKKKGTYQVSISQPLCLPTEYSLSIANTAKPWPSGDAAAALGIGESDFWSFDAKRGDIIRLEGAAEQFDLTILLYNSAGDIVAQNDDGAGGFNPLIVMLMQDDGRYILRAKAHGDGGSGLYKLKRTAEAVRRLAMNSRETSTIAPGSSEIWSFEGKAGQNVIVSVRSDEFDTAMRIYGPDALEVASAGYGGEDTSSLAAIRLPLDGTYTVWVYGSSGGGKYTIRWLDLDK